MWPLRRLHRAARHVLFFAHFGRSLPAHAGDAALRDQSWRWAIDGAAESLEAARAPDGAVGEHLARCQTAVNALRDAAPDDRRAAFTALADAARALCLATRPTAVTERGAWALGIAFEYARQLALTLATSALVTWLVATNAAVRSVVSQSRAGHVAIAVLTVISLAVFARQRPLGRGAFWHPLALPPTEDASAPYPPALASRRIATALVSALAVAVLLMALTGLAFGGFDASYRSPFLLASEMGALFLVAHALDVWDYFDPRRIRLGGAVLGGLFVWLSLGYAPDEPWDTRPLPAAARWVQPQDFPRDGDGPVVMFALSGGGSRSAIYSAMALAALDRELPQVTRAAHVVSAVSGGSLAAAGYVASRLGRVRSERYVAAMEDDYVWPLLRAAFTPETRADAVVGAWTDALHARDLTLSSVAEAYRAGRAPLPIFNAADVHGHGVMLSPFAAGALDGSETRRACKESRTTEAAWVCDRDATHDLQGMLPRIDLPLLAGTRASANFPLAFPLVPVRATAMLAGHEQFGDPYATRITDGGLHLNSGVMPLYNLALSRRDALRRRGLLLVIIDAGATRAYAGSAGEWDILQALKRAGVGRTQLLHRVMIDRLAAEFGGRFACARVDPDPTEFSGIPTSWYLGADEREVIRRQFRSPRWIERREDVREAYESAAAGEGEAWVESCLARPPLG